MPATASGTLTRNVSRQPPAAMSRPPSGGPTAMVACPAMASAPSTPPGASRFSRRAWCRTIAIAAG